MSGKGLRILRSNYLILYSYYYYVVVIRTMATKQTCQPDVPMTGHQPQAAALAGKLLRVHPRMALGDAQVMLDSPGDG